MLTLSTLVQKVRPLDIIFDALNAFTFSVSVLYLTFRHVKNRKCDIVILVSLNLMLKSISSRGCCLIYQITCTLQAKGNTDQCTLP